MKYSKKKLLALENLIGSSGLKLRYEKGQFKSGYCLLRQEQVVVVNKYFTPEGRFNCLLELIPELDFNPDKLSAEAQDLYQKVLDFTPNT